MKLKTVGISLLAAALFGAPFCGISPMVYAETNVMQQDDGVVKGVVKDQNGEPVFGAIVFVVGTTNSAQVDFDGNYSLNLVRKGVTVRAQMMGYSTVDKVWNGGKLDFVLQEETSQLDELVVTAMGIMRKEKSLTYATQQIKAADLLQVQDVNLVNSIEGKISGVTITPSAGGAGGASKILLRGNKSIQGENSPLIVIDGVPMTNSIRGQQSAENLTYSSNSEGSDPLSMINPDDIESMNVLKGANAAALYGSRAANGVVMITTKKGKQGKMEVTFNSNTTFETPLLTPDIQNMYGAASYNVVGDFVLKPNSWGDRLSGSGKYVQTVGTDQNYIPAGTVRDIYLRNYGKDDIADFFSTGLTTNNSVSVSGGTEKIQTYVSYSNSYSEGMIDANKYVRNTFAFRQTYKLWERLTINVNANYVQSKTKNRVGGGTIMNPIYDLYTMARDVDMDYYKNNYVADGEWMSSTGNQNYWVSEGAGGNSYKPMTGCIVLSGPMQQWAYQSPMYNNPYWLTNKLFSEAREDRFFGNFQANLQIIEGLNLQARVSLDHTKYNSEGGRYATTWSIVDMERYGVYSLSNSRTDEIYTDFLLSYNKQLNDDWSLSATAGYVGHTIKGTSVSTYVANATIDNRNNLGISTSIADEINIFDPKAGGPQTTSKSKSSNWDQAALFTAQVGWKDMVFFDASYRQDWYRPFKQFKYLGTDESYGYFGLGANAVVSDIIKLPEWISYIKYRASYSEVGNSIPNVYYNGTGVNYVTGAIQSNGYNSFIPEPEKTKSFETGLETSFFRDRLSLDITYYNSAMHNSYLNIAGKNGKTQPVNSGIIRNQGIELTVGYDWAINKDWRWKTSVNYSYNDNEIEETYKDETGKSVDMETLVASNKIQVLYRKGGSYGDMYITDFVRWDEDVYSDDGALIHKKGDLKLSKDGDISKSSNPYGKFIGNMNSKQQLSWSNTVSYKNFSLYLLINGRIGGKVVSLTEGYLDKFGVSARTGAAREYAEKNGIYAADGSLGMYINEGRDIVSIESYYTKLGEDGIEPYVYDATNFRLRELSFGYTFRNLFGEYKNLNLSFVCRNLFFIYKDSPVDPDVSLSTGNGLGGFDVFNMPSARSYGFNLKLNL